MLQCYISLHISDTQATAAQHLENAHDFATLRDLPIFLATNLACKKKLSAISMADC